MFADRSVDDFVRGCSNNSKDSLQATAAAMRPNMNEGY